MAEKEVKVASSEVDGESLVVNGADEEPQRIHLKMTGADRQLLDCQCEAVGGNGDSVIYDCSYQVADASEEGNGGADKEDGRVTRKKGASRIRGKFSMNVP